jgi:chromosomal replication initiation ATPase DnaA
MTARQLPLDLGHRPALGGEDFLVAPCNAEALEWLDRWPDWPGPALVVHGPAGCGKTHLAHVFAARSGAPVLAAAGLHRDDPPRLLAAARALVLEDADRGVDEVALFHLYNLVKEAGAKLLLTAALPSGRWPVALPDLASRLKTAPNAAILPPDDALMAALLVKLFADRQLRVGQELIAYLLPRLERSFQALRQVVAKLDAAALAERREITVPLARRVLEQG